MTINQFLDALSVTEYPWHVNDSGEITDDNDDCPLWAVYRERGPDEDVEDYIAAGRAVGLTSKTASRIAAAADNRGNDKRLRQRLLAAAGIGEPVG